MNIQSLFLSLSIYPIPTSALHEIAARRGVDLEAEGNAESLSQESYLLAKADVLLWLSAAPNVSQDGVSYSFSEYERKQFKAYAMSLYKENGENKARYGYKGSRL